MNFTKVFSLFALLILAVLSVGAVSAQPANPDGCINVTSSTFPSSVSQTSGSFSGGFVLVNGFSTTLCSTRTINSVSLSSNIGTWTPILSGVPSSLTSSGTTSSATINGTNSFPTTSTGAITTTLTVDVNSSTTNNLIYTFTLPVVTLTSPPTSSNLSISVQGTQPFLVGQNVSLTVNNPNGLSNIIMSETGTTLFGVTFSPSTLTNAVSQTVQTILTNLQNLKFGLNTINVQASAGAQTTTANFQLKKTFCSASTSLPTNLTIKSIEWSNDGAGDEDKWELLDELEIEVEVKNDNNDDDVDAVIELGLFDSSGKNVADDLIFIGESEEDEERVELNIDEDDEATATFRFRVPADFDAGNYRMAIKVYDDDNGESAGCRDTSNDFDNSYFQSIDVIEASDEGRFVAIGDFSIDSQVTCGSTLTGQFTLFNIGEDDQDRVRVTIRNSELNINEQVELTNDLDKGEEETMTFSVQIPPTATNGNKKLEFFAEYDYKNGKYREESDDSTEYSVELIGCAVNLANPTTGLTGILVDAKLNSDSIAGEELVVITTITNDGNSKTTLSIDANEFDDWAELTDISEDLITLDAGESKEITMKFLVNEDASGSQAFNIELSSAGKIQVQEVEVELAEAKKFPSLNFKGNSTLWLIGLVNLALIVLIVIVAIRLSRK